MHNDKDSTKKSAIKSLSFSFGYMALFSNVFPFFMYTNDI